MNIAKKDFAIDDWDEIQEFHHIRFTGGYGSVCGDGMKVECDICQRCLHIMIKDFFGMDMNILLVNP